MRKITLALWMAGCATHYEAPFHGFTSVTVRVSAIFAISPTCADAPDLHADLAVEGVDEACQLTVSFGPSKAVATGDCPDIPTGGRPLMTLWFYVVAPSGGPRIGIAESIGRAPLDSPDGMFVDVSFDPSTQPSLAFKTSGGATETGETKDLFNRDRGAGVGDDLDTCSNYQELCAGTLYLSQNDQCSR